MTSQMEGYSSSPAIGSNEPQEPTIETSEVETEVPTNRVVEINSDGDEVIDKSRLRSDAWKSFQKVRDKKTGLFKARCLFCKKKLVAQSKSGTTHLNDHSKCCTQKKLSDSKQKVLTPGFMMGEGKRKLEAYIFNQEFARKQLAHMIIMHEYPLSIVDHVGFKRFAHALQPSFRMVSRNTIKSDILKIYDVEKVNTMKLMEGNRSRVCVTTDMWTASNQKRGFMVITTHFIDDSWKLQSRIIRFVYVPCPHTAEVLCDVLMDTFLEWNIDRKLSTLTVDNCSTNDAMIPLLLEKFGGGSQLWCASLFHVRCACHILNLIVKDGLDVIKASIEKVRDSVAFWTATPKREEKFEDAVRQLQINLGKKLSLDCATRWNSTYLMLQTAIEYKDVFKRLRLRDNHYKCCPDENDWALAIEICERLKVFYEVTELFSGTKYPTSNMFFACVCNIKVELEKWVVCGNEVVQNMAFRMIEKYDKYWENTHGILGVASVLDPRFKMVLIKYCFSQIYVTQSLVDASVENVRTLCYDLLTLYQSSNDNDCGGSSECSSKPASTFVGVQLEGFDLFVSKNKKCKTSHVKSELDHYLEEDVIPRSENFDILVWWQSHGMKYPTLQAMARDVLSIPVSTVASESSFSTSGRVVSPNRNRLHPKTLEALMCAQSWLFALENGGEPTMPGNRFATINNDEVDDDCVSSVMTIDD